MLEPQTSQAAHQERAKVTGSIVEPMPVDRLWTMIATAKRLLNDVETIVQNRADEVKNNSDLFGSIQEELAGLVSSLTGTVRLISD